MVQGTKFVISPARALFHIYWKAWDHTDWTEEGNVMVDKDVAWKVLFQIDVTEFGIIILVNPGLFA